MLEPVQRSEAFKCVFWGSFVVAVQLITIRLVGKKIVSVQMDTPPLKTTNEARLITQACHFSDSRD